jgi:putative ABC transport system ATP-binding protein
MRVEISGLRHTYAGHGLEERNVLRIDEWQAESGSSWLLHGVSGSGKTTFLNIIAGLLPPSAGSVRLDGRDIYSESESQRDRRRASQIGYVYQVQLLVPILSAQENVEMALVYGSSLSAAERRERAREMLAHVDLAGFERHRPAQLSVGQRLRVAVARALAAEPPLLLADEPTAALDVEAARVVVDLLMAYQSRRAATLLVASHDPALDQHFARRSNLVEGGLVEGPPGMGSADQQATRSDDRAEATA